MRGLKIGVGKHDHARQQRVRHQGSFTVDIKPGQDTKSIQDYSSKMGTGDAP